MRSQAELFLAQQRKGDTANFAYIDNIARSY